MYNLFLKYAAQNWTVVISWIFWSLLKDLYSSCNVFQEHVQRITEDKNLAEQSRGDLQQDVQHLEQKLQKAQEQERLLVEYPDLNGPVNPDFSGKCVVICTLQNFKIISPNCQSWCFWYPQTQTVMASVCDILNCIHSFSVLMGSYGNNSLDMNTCCLCWMSMEHVSSHNGVQYKKVFHLS